MSEILDVYAAEAGARKYRDMAATEFLSSNGYKWERYEWVAPDGLTPRQLSEQRAELLAFIQRWAGDGCLQTFEDRQRFRAEARAIANATQQRKEPGA